MIEATEACGRVGSHLPHTWKMTFGTDDNEDAVLRKCPGMPQMAGGGRIDRPEPSYRGYPDWDDTERWAEANRRDLGISDPRQQARVVAAKAAADRAQEKADRLAARAKALQRVEQVAEQDPFPDGTNLRIRWNDYTFLALRVRGLWYTTGRTGPHQANWYGFVTWLAAADTLVVTQLSPAGVHHLFGDGS